MDLEFAPLREDDHLSQTIADTTRPGLARKKRHAYGKDLTAYFILGLINNFSYVVMLSAAKDLLEGTNIRTGVVLLADVFPTLLVKLTAPLFMHRLPYRLRVCIVVGFALVSYQMVAHCDGVLLKLLGVVCTSISAGFGEVTFLALSSFYHRNTISTWSSGTGGAGIGGSVAYLALTSWLGLSPKEALLVLSPTPLILAVAYSMVLGPRGAAHSPARNAASDMRLRDRIAFVRMHLLRRYITPLLVVYFSEYLINQGIAPVLLFPDGPIKPREQYVYYQAIYQIGVFMSRSSVNLFPIRRLYVPPALQALNLLGLTLHVLLGLLPNVWTGFAVIFWEGLLGGATYVNTFFRISIELQPDMREFSLGITSLADCTGIFLAGIAAVYVEKWLDTAS